MPSACIAFALDVIARVGEGFKSPARAERLRVVTTWKYTDGGSEGGSEVVFCVAVAK